MKIILNGQELQIYGIAGVDGKSAYEVAVELGFEGTEQEWLESLKGSQGEDGKSAYQIAVDNGFEGTEEEWLESLKGKDGESGSSTSLGQLVNAPLGAIIIWSGTEDNIPEGWNLCDGSNGTIDLRDKFVLGAGERHAVGDAGGSEEVTLTVEQMPNHNHSFSLQITESMSPDSNNYRSFVHINHLANTVLSTGSMDKGGSQPHPNMPPYYTLCYIQKISQSFTDYLTVADIQAITIEELDEILV